MAKDKTNQELFDELGINPSDPGQAVERLRALWTGDSADPVKIATLAGHLAIPEAAQLLAEMETGAGGSLRREIRRSLFKLRQHGIGLITAEPARPTIAAPTEAVSAILSPVDPEGAQLVWLFKQRPQGGVARLYGLTSETEGLVGAQLSHLSRRELREDRRNIEQRSSIKLIDADYRLADFILCDAYRRTPESRLGQVGNFLMIRAEILASPPPTDYRHPIYDEFAGTLDQDPSPELLKEPELEGWIVPQSDLKPYLSEIEEIRQSPLVLNQFQQQERINTVAGRALEELFSGERGDRMRRRLEMTAYYLAHTGRTQAARWAASAAAQIRDGHNLARVPFFVQFVMRSMGLAMSEKQEQTEREPRLIMTPAEAMRAQQAAQARRLRR